MRDALQGDSKKFSVCDKKRYCIELCALMSSTNIPLHQTMSPDGEHSLNC